MGQNSGMTREGQNSGMTRERQNSGMTRERQNSGMTRGERSLKTVARNFCLLEVMNSKKTTLLEGCFLLE